MKFKMLGNMLNLLTFVTVDITIKLKSHLGGNMKEFDIISIGGGSGGIATMNRAGEHGARCRH